MKGRGTECEGTGGGFWSLGKRGCAAAVVSSPRSIGEDAWDPAGEKRTDNVLRRYDRCRFQTAGSCSSGLF